MANFKITGNVEPFLKVELKDGEKLYCDSNSMISMHSNLDLDGKMKGGFFGAFKRKLLNNESFFQQEITASRGDGEVVLGPNFTGDILLLDVDDNHNFFLADSSYLASSENIRISPKKQKISGAFFGNTGGLFVMQTGGYGLVAISGFGSLEIIDINTSNEDKPFIVDNSHIVAWSSDLNYGIGYATNRESGIIKNVMNSYTTSEGTIMKFWGKGRVIISSRNRYTYAAIMNNLLLPYKTYNNNG